MTVVLVILCVPAALCVLALTVCTALAVAGALLGILSDRD